MMQRRLAAWVLAGVLALVPARARGHSGPGVLVDTDMAADDARALALLLKTRSLANVRVDVPIEESWPDPLFVRKVIGPVPKAKSLLSINRPGVEITVPPE